MQTPLFVDGQFVDGTLLNSAVAMLMNDFGFIGDTLHSAGLVSSGSMTITPSNLVLTISLPPPFAVLFGNGDLIGANGLVSGATTHTYTLDLTSARPGSGTQTIYILASAGQIGEDQIQVIGPPEGHPDFDATFSPFNWYVEGLDTIAISASTTPADNITTFELAHLPLQAGQTIINPTSILNTWRFASSVLNPTGVPAGTYPAATVTVSGDGRVTGIVSGAYGALFSANEWHGTNTFDLPTIFNDPGPTPTSAGVIISGGTSAGVGILLKGNGATTPNKTIRVLNGVLQVVSSTFSGVIWALTDTGNMNVSGNIVANGAVSGLAAGFGTGGVITTGGVHAQGGAFGAGGLSTSGTIVASGASINCFGGRLRASFGARGSGDVNAAVILEDTVYAVQALNQGQLFLPEQTGCFIQFLAVSAPVGNGTIQTNFDLPVPYPKGFSFAMLCFGGNGPPLDVAIAVTPVSLNQVQVSTSSNTATGDVAITILAIGN